MKAEVTYRYNELDKQHEFGLLFFFEGYAHLAYINWIWFHMGSRMYEVKTDMKRDKNEFIIYPYSLKTFTGSKIIGKYNFNEKSERLANLISNKIIKTLLKNKK